MTADFLVKVRGEYNQFTEAEERVANYILGYPKKILFISITELTEVCNVGGTSVFRFCKTMNCKGYREFKMLLSLSLSEDRQDMGQIERDVDLGDTLDKVVQKVLVSNINALRETQSLLKRNHSEQVIQYFHDTTHICFYGVGTSMTTAMKAAGKFLGTESKVYCASDSHIQTMVVSTITKDEMAVVLSYSGTTEDTTHVVQPARQVEAKIVCITRFVKSPLTAYGDMVLLCGTNESPLQADSSSTEVGQLFLIDLLYTEYYRRYYDICNVNNGETSASIMEKLC